MILDHHSNLCLYYGTNKNMDIALTYLKHLDLSNLNFTRQIIEGTDIVVMVQEYKTKALTEGKWEAHRKYIDLQYVVEGVEKMGYANIRKMTPVTEYNEKDDAILFEGEGSYFHVEIGNFAIFAPEDVHMPSILIDESKYVKKIILKIPVETSNDI